MPFPLILVPVGGLALFFGYRWWRRTAMLPPPVRSPVGRVSSEFGPRVSPIDQKPSLHAGIDIAGVAGAPVVVVEPGTVAVSRLSESAGEYVVIAGSSGRRYEYMHLASGSRAVDVGDAVEVGTVLGKVGATGRVTGAHLHYEIREPERGNARGKPVNPRKYHLTFWGP